MNMMYLGLFLYRALVRSVTVSSRDRQPNGREVAEVAWLVNATYRFNLGDAQVLDIKSFINDAFLLNPESSEGFLI